MTAYFADPSAPNPTPTGKFSFGWGYGAYSVGAIENGPTVFGGPVLSPTFIPGTYVMTSGVFDVQFIRNDLFPIDPNFPDDFVTIPTAGDVLTIDRIGSTSPVPEPPSFYLSAVGLLGIGFLAKRIGPSFG